MRGIGKLEDTVMSYHAMPDAIPNTTEWLVVPCRADYSPIYAAKDRWQVVARFDTFEAAVADAERRTAMLAMICR